MKSTVCLLFFFQYLFFFLFKSDNSSGFQSDNDVDILKREKTDLEAKFYFEKQELLTKIASLEEEILVKQHQLVEAENKIKNTVSFSHKFCLMKFSSETLQNLL